jgi:hypothetical protein
VKELECRVAAAAIMLVRRVLDRIADPYVERAVGGVIESIGNDVGEASHSQPTLELHAALHEARSLALADVPGGADTVLSAGANGL